SVTISSDMLGSIPGIAGKKAEISIDQDDKNGLPDDVKAAIGERPLISLSLLIDGRQTNWSNPNSPVTVNIPYTPKEEELKNPDSIVIWYIDGSGNPQCVTNGHYDPVTGTVTFDVTHFSDYAVVYNPVNFNDVKANAWYYKAVSFIAARDITNGTGNGNYSPEAKLTRADFIVIMMKAYGIAPDTNPADNFTDAGNTYYTNYLAAAKRLNISAGVGNNMFAPGKEITRQEMFTILYNALKVIGELPQGDSGKTLSDFSDSNSIADWAKEAVTQLVKTGTISGSAGKLLPQSVATRAEIAQVMYQLMKK
ncbi:MAG: S-layer homology domain-containing protein, partial [Clostridiales bacterium]|nr:S-layer homology domain-containing protein [Clostridiales bacterium]